MGDLTVTGVQTCALPIWVTFEEPPRPRFGRTLDTGSCGDAGAVLARGQTRSLVATAGRREVFSLLVPRPGRGAGRGFLIGRAAGRGRGEDLGGGGSFKKKRGHGRFDCDGSSDVCSSDLGHVRRTATPAIWQDFGHGFLRRRGRGSRARPDAFTGGDGG